MGFYNCSQNLEILSLFFKQVKLEPGSLATGKGYSFAMLSKEIVKETVLNVFYKTLFL